MRRGVEFKGYLHSLAEYPMKRTDNKRHSLVDFLGSIKFSREPGSSDSADKCHSHFARPQSRTRREQGSEDAQLVRSAN